MNNYPDMQISNKVKAIPEALSVYMNNVVYAMKRRGDSVRVLSLGEAFLIYRCFRSKRSTINKVITILKAEASLN